jgi:hypothetical protein
MGVLVQVGGLLGGVVLGLAAVERYPFLDPRTFTTLVWALPIVFAVSFIVIRADRFPPNTPPWARVMFRLGATIWFCGASVGIIGLANGIRSPVELRDVPCISKRRSGEDHQIKRAYYLTLQPWPGSAAFAEVRVRPVVWAAVRAGSPVRLAVGRGHLGLEWISDVSAISP